MTGKRKREVDDADDAKKVALDPDGKAVISPVNNEDHEDGAETTPLFDLIFCGSTKWSMIGRKSVPKGVRMRGGSDAGELVMGPSVVRFPSLSLPNARFTKVCSGPTAAHCVLLTPDGAAYGVGRNESGQLGCAKPIAQWSPILLKPQLEKGERVVGAACARSTTLLRTSRGLVWAAGANLHGELGDGSRARSDASNKWRRVVLPADEEVVNVAAGAEFSVFVCASGAVYVAGCGQYGQLGNGRSDGSLVTNNRLEFEEAFTPLRVDGFGGSADEARAQTVACGTNHALVLDADGRVWSWGWGAYGRLGHRTNADESRPRRIEAFDTAGYSVTDIACGATSSMAYIKSRKQLMFWGISKTSGESTMYPKPVYDLMGWDVRSFSLGPTSAVVAADSDVISWGGSPTFGELGYGDGVQKSSTKPKQMSALQGLHVAQVEMGAAFTFILVSARSDEEREIIEKLPEIDFDDVS